MDGIAVLTGCGVSMLCLMLLSLDKYVGIVLAQSKNPYLRAIKPLSINQAIGASACIWVFIFGYACLPFAFAAEGYTYALQSSHLVCVWTWWDIDHPLVISGSVVTILVVVGGSSLMVVIYYLIIDCVITSTKKLNNMMMSLQTSNDHPSAVGSKGRPSNVEKAQGLSREEKRLIVNGMIISGCFILSWVPYVILVIIEMATKSPISAALDAFRVITCTFNSILNPIILFIFDLRVQTATIDLLGVKGLSLGSRSRSQRSRPKPVSASPSSKNLNWVGFFKNILAED